VYQVGFITRLFFFILQFSLFLSTAVAGPNHCPNLVRGSKSLKNSGLFFCFGGADGWVYKRKY
jgi:hypothetical protein